MRVTYKTSLDEKASPEYNRNFGCRVKAAGSGRKKER